MNDVQIFENPEFGSIRTIDIDGTPYWVAVDVTKILGYKRSNDAIKQHCKNGVKLLIPHTNTVKHRIGEDTNTVEQGVRKNDIGSSKTYVIPESDLYRLIVNSKLPKAKAFEKWVFESVLPQIRRTGAYAAQPQETVSSADIQALRDEIREIKSLIAQPQPPALPAPKKEVTYKAYINAALDILEKQCGQPRSAILHRCYRTFSQHGYNVDDIKAEFMERHNLSQCTAIDAILDDPLGARNLVYLVQAELIRGMDNDIDKIMRKT